MGEEGGGRREERARQKKGEGREECEVLMTTIPLALMVSEKGRREGRRPAPFCWAKYILIPSLQTASV